MVVQPWAASALTEVALCFLRMTPDPRWMMNPYLLHQSQAMSRSQSLKTYLPCQHHPHASLTSASLPQRGQPAAGVVPQMPLHPCSLDRYYFALGFRREQGAQDLRVV